MLLQEACLFAVMATVAVGELKIFACLQLFCSYLEVVLGLSMAGIPPAAKPCQARSASAWFTSGHRLQAILWPLSAPCVSWQMSRSMVTDSKAHDFG